jgi:RNA polymerase-interacting CarD/CdnL/TRCF family regulator
MEAKKSHQKPGAKKWSKKVTETSHAMDLKPNVFKSESAKKIASSLKTSAEKSKTRKTTPFQSAMSVLNFYKNRAGDNLSASKKKVLDSAKKELRKLFHKEK